MKAGCWLALMIAVPTIVLAQTRVTFHTPDSASIEADLYGKAPPPKKWLVLDGSAHGQRIFDTEQGPRLRREILRFLAEP